MTSTAEQGAQAEVWLHSVSGYGNIAVKFNIHLLFLKFSLTPSIKAAVSEGVSRTENALVDIDGDGYPDFVEVMVQISLSSS